MSDYVRTFFDASTSHVSEAGRNWLDEIGQENAGGISLGHTVGLTPNGWFFWAGEDDDSLPDDTPDCVAAVCKQARSMGCSYVLLDNDAPAFDGLAQYDW